nr:hypothetical protein [Sporomusa ovata]EQB27068.1 hypothetical protein SOV_3c09480 [Sporomusa ovata DSM 2662]
MKSRFFVIWSVLVVLAGLMLFAGCGNNSATTASGPAKKIIRVGTSGEYYPLCFKKIISYKDLRLTFGMKSVSERAMK